MAVTTYDRMRGRVARADRWFSGNLARLERWYGWRKQWIAKRFYRLGCQVISLGIKLDNKSIWRLNEQTPNAHIQITIKGRKW